MLSSVNRVLNSLQKESLNFHELWHSVMSARLQDVYDSDFHMTFICSSAPLVSLMALQLAHLDLSPSHGSRKITRQ